MLPNCAVHSETTRAIIDHPGLQPDILITAIDRAPVVIEAEYMPAYTAEDEAKARLGLRLADGGKRIEAAIALRYPSDVANAPDLDSAIRAARLEYAVFYLTTNPYHAPSTSPKWRTPKPPLRWFFK